MIELKLSTYRNESMNNHLLSDEMKIIILKIMFYSKKIKSYFFKKMKINKKKLFKVFIENLIWKLNKITKFFMDNE